ncbi:MAG: hypothetical protein OXB88_02715 [Bacteriovoracales bacterium]|nr:hypothetical protein [Bacteriovoracales bacterium]
MKWPSTVMKEARDEAYEYFDKNIRPLTRGKNGKIDPSAVGLENNDVDAFRHAYVSGVFIQVYNEKTADILGRLNEYKIGDLYSNTKYPRSLNMDLWNNSIGRKYGKKAKTRKELLEKIHEALKRGELIIDLTDPRQYDGAKNNPINKSKPVIVLEEGEKGRNEIFFDVEKEEILSRSDFVAKIQAGEYSGYTVKEINGVLTPVSNPDSRETNNLS